MKSLAILNPAGTHFARSMSMTLTVAMVLSAAPNMAEARWFGGPKDKTVEVESTKKGDVITISQKPYPALKIEKDPKTGNIIIDGGSGHREPIDTGLKNLETLGVPTGLEVVSTKNDLKTYQLKGDDQAEPFVLHLEKGSVLVLRIRTSDNKFHDHVLNIHDKTPIASVNLNATVPKEEGGNRVFTLKLTFTDGRTQSIDYNSSLDKSLEPIKLPSIYEAFEKLKKSQEESKTITTKIKEKVYGQDFAVERLTANLLETKTNGMTKPKVLMLQGSSGVGKSFIAQSLVDLIYSPEERSKRFMEIAGSQFNAGTHSLDYITLVGGNGSNSPKGSLIEFLKANEGNGVLVINEADKMHADVWKRLMELLEKGRITDNEGKEVWAKNLVVLMTSNKGATRMFPSSVANWTQAEIDKRVRTLDQNEMKSYYMQKENQSDQLLPREILNRIDEVIPFGPLSQEAAVQIAQTKAKEVSNEYRTKYGIIFEVEPALIHHIALTGFTAADDARQIGNQIKMTYSQIFNEGIHKIEIKAGSTVKMNLETNSAYEKIIVAETEGRRMEIAGPKERKANALQDPAKMAQLKRLEADLKAQVVGQDVALNEIAKAIMSYDLDPVKTAPFSALLIGTSGNGKTETARALAKSEFGDEKRLGIMAMGTISTMADFDNNFGVGGQFQSGETERAFEKILRENPQGCVIVLDEISNMGGNDLSMKNSLLKKFYEMLDEGRWSSPRDGRVYDLKKYKFIMTGNDGEDAFTGITSDDLLLDTWEHERDPSKVRETLRRSGLPNAFINRIKVKILMKPLLSNEVDAVTQKLFNRKVRDYVNANPGIEVLASAEFRQKLAKAYFAPDQGGRAIRDVLDNNFGTLFATSLVASGIDTIHMKNVKMVIDIEDNRLTKPYSTPNAQERKVNFVAQVFQDDVLVSTEKVDATQFAVAQVLMSSKSARAVAYHEAGHAIANDPQVTGEKTTYVTIRGGKTRELEYYGYARTREIKGQTTFYDHGKVVAMIARLWAGRKAQEMAGFTADAGWSNDLEKIRKIGSTYLTKWGLDRDLIALPVDDKGVPLVHGPKAELYNQRLQQLIDEGEQYAEQLLKSRWRAVRAMTGDLLAHGEIQESRIDEIQAKIAQGPASGLKKVDWDYSKYQMRASGNMCSKVLIN